MTFVESQQSTIGALQNEKIALSTRLDAAESTIVGILARLKLADA